MDTKTQGWIDTGVGLVKTVTTSAVSWVDGLFKGTANTKWLLYVVGAIVALKVLPGMFGKRGRR